MSRDDRPSKDRGIILGAEGLRDLGSGRTLQPPKRERYENQQETKKAVEYLKRYGRPILCTEYMARPAGSTFAANSPYFKDNNVAAYCWGFVSGKTQTIYPWDSWEKKYDAEPTVWFHDIFRSDGKAYDENEVTLIRRLTAKAASRAK